MFPQLNAETETDAYDFELPDERIARFPAEPRDEAKLLCVDRKTGMRAHATFDRLTGMLTERDLLILNNTKVLPARLFGSTFSGKSFEIFLLKREASASEIWRCLARPGKRILETGTNLKFDEAVSGLVRRMPDSSFTIEFTMPAGKNFLDWLQRNGELPLPPYLKRGAEKSDGENYQTVFAKHEGSVAAPTAGLHFSERMIDELRTHGIGTAEVTLHIGYGTFSPLRPENWESGKLHSEFFSVPDSTLAAMRATRERGGRIIAVGTTALRAIESLEEYGQSGETKLFIRPGFTFRWTDGLITNFHLPRSSLFVLVSSFLGLETTHECYREAIAGAYRFYSYGDAMLIV